MDGQTLTLAASGWTYDNTFVLWDRETGTLWYPFNRDGQRGLTGIAGPLQDRFLPELASTRASWKDWHRQHPESKFMEYPYAPLHPW